MIKNNQHPFYSVTLDVVYGRIILGGVIDTGEILITKTPHDKVSTESFLKNPQNMSFEFFSPSEFNLISSSLMNMPITGRSVVQNSSIFEDLNEDPTVTQTVVYLKNDTQSYQTHKGNISTLFYDAS